MSPEMEALARRAVACPGWRWAAGMVATGGYIVVCVDERGTAFLNPSLKYAAHFWTAADVRWNEQRRVAGSAYVEYLPDITDPATLGALAELAQAQLAGLADRLVAGDHGMRVAHAWHEWFMGREDRRAQAMVEAVEVQR